MNTPLISVDRIVASALAYIAAHQNTGTVLAHEELSRY